MSFDTCRRITAANSKSFYFASFPLPKEKRNATFATYAFCRTADDIADTIAPGEELEARRRLDELRRLLDDIEAGVIPSHPLWGPFACTIRDFAVPLHPFRQLLDGIESDLTPRTFRTFLELKEYCFAVASTVGIALSHIFGFDESEALEYAANMGVAMQLTNIIRDVGEDQRMGRIYLPLEEIEAHGYSIDHLERGVVDEPFRRLMDHQIRRAREYYRRAFQGIRYLTRDGSHWTAYLMGDVYRGILSAVEANQYDVFTRRAFISTPQKVARTIAAPLNFRREVLLNTAPILALPETE